MHLHRRETVELSKCIDDVGVVPLTGTPTDVFNPLDRGHQGPSVKTSAGDRVVRVSYRENARAEGNDVPLETRRISGPVPSFVMVSHDRGDFGERGMLGDHVGADVRMASHDLPFLFSQRTGLVEN